MVRLLFGAAAIVLAAVAVYLTWRRLFLGMDLADESFYVLVPWRWTLGDLPFVQEENLAQVGSLLAYPAAEVFALVRHHDVTGYVLYMRHAYLLLMLGVAAVSFWVTRRLVRWEAALLICAVFVTFIFWQTPQLSYNTMGAAFLTMGAALLLGGLLDRRRWCVFLSGAVCGLAVVSYPTLVFVVPFYAVFIAFAAGRRSVDVISELRLSPAPDDGGAPTGRAAWKAVSAWVAGGLAVLLPVALIVLSFGLSNVRRCWEYSMSVARSSEQLGGAAKAVTVAQGVLRFLWSRPYLVVAVLLVYFVYTRWPRAGRGLLALLPVALWLAGQRAMLNASGFVIVYAFLAPYLYLFVPRRRRKTGAVMLLAVWAPSVLAGAMTAFTSAAGYLNAAVGLLPALLASGVFLAWSLEACGVAPGSPGTGTEDRDRKPRAEDSREIGWSSILAFVVLAAVVAVTVTFQFQFQERDVPYRDLSVRCDFGPWAGISVTRERYDQLKTFSDDMRRQARPDDQLLIFDQSVGYYLFWNGGVAANSYWITSPVGARTLPQATIDYYRRHRIVPTLAVHFIATAGLSDAALAAACGGLGYPPTLVRPSYAFQRKPPGETTAEVLARLPVR